MAEAVISNSGGATGSGEFSESAATSNRNSEPESESAANVSNGNEAEAESQKEVSEEQGGGKDDESVKNISLFGASMPYDAEKGEGSFRKEVNFLEMLTGKDSISTGIDIPIVPGVSVGFEAGINASATAALDILVNKKGNAYEYTIIGDLGGINLEAYAKGSGDASIGIASAGFSLMAKGGIDLAGTKLQATGNFIGVTTGDTITPVPTSFDIQADLVLPFIVDFILDIHASVGVSIFSKDFDYTLEIPDYELTRFEFSESIAWDLDSVLPEGTLDMAALLSSGDIGSVIPSVKSFIGMF